LGGFWAFVGTTKKLGFSKNFMCRLATLVSPPGASAMDTSLRGCDGGYCVWVLM